MQTLVTIHSWVRWLVLFAVATGAVFGFIRYRVRAEWKPHVHQVELMIFDIQVTVGIVLWIFLDGWDRGFFFSIMHPVLMLAALALLHTAMAIAGRNNSFRSWLFMGSASAVSLVLIVGAIPWDRL